MMEGKATEVGSLLSQPFSVALGEESFTSQFVCLLETSVLGASKACVCVWGVSTGSQVDWRRETGAKKERQRWWRIRA